MNSLGPLFVTPLPLSPLAYFANEDNKTNIHSQWPNCTSTYQELSHNAPYHCTTFGSRCPAQCSRIPSHQSWFCVHRCGRRWRSQGLRTFWLSYLQHSRMCIVRPHWFPVDQSLCKCTGSHTAGQHSRILLRCSKPHTWTQSEIVAKTENTSLNS